jgi:hypothetical protein
MRSRSSVVFTGFAMFFALISLVVGPALAEESFNIKGWEKGGDYDQLFDVAEKDSIKGWVREIIEITPLDGMTPGIGLIVEDKKDRAKETVHLGPKEFVKLDSIGLKEGDMVKVVGAWAEVDGQDVMMAIKVKKTEDIQIKVRRSKDGFPYWEMTAEERQKELTGD